MPMIVTMPYGDIVLPTEDALTLMKLLEKAEKYRCNYKSGQDSTHHIYPLPDQMQSKLITQETYAMYKLAGKPED
jgi:hypothetical protein